MTKNIKKCVSLLKKLRWVGCTNIINYSNHWWGFVNDKHKKTDSTIHPYQILFCRWTTHKQIKYIDG